MPATDQNGGSVDPIDEVIVIGGGPSGPIPPVPGTIGFPFFPGAGSGGSEFDIGLVPPVVPGVIEEIVTTAKRPASAGPFTSSTTSTAARLGIAGVLAAAGGFIASKFLEQISQTKLDEAGQLATRTDTPGPDTPVIVTQTETIPEIIVTAPRLRVLSYLLPPLPQFFPFRDLPDPFIMQPIGPAPAIPRPEVQPDVDVTAPTIPRTRPATVPLRTPLMVPMPLPVPATSPRTAPPPRIAPFVLPQTTPAPTGQPSPVPRPAIRPQGGTRPRPLTRTRTGVLPSPLGQPQPSIKRPPDCPPCPKDPEQQKVREQCFKKLVKEGITADLDEEFPWVEIDCLSGREL